MEGAQAPFGFWDPFGFAKTSPEALTWYRAAELKHGRVAMVACMGFIAQSYPLTNMASVPLAKASLYPKLSTVDVTFGDLAAAGNPVEQFKLIPTLGLWQFAFVAGMIETYGEFQKPHYLRGGAIGRNTLIWDPVGQLIRGEPITDTLSDEVRAKKTQHGAGQRAARDDRGHGLLGALHDRRLRAVRLRKLLGCCAAAACMGSGVNWLYLKKKK